MGSAAPVGERGWAHFDYLHWWIKSGPLAAPLAVQSTPGSNGSLSTLGQAGTTVVLANALDFGGFSGGRIGVGYWIDQADTAAVEATGFLIGPRAAPPGFANSTTTTSTTGLGIPFFSVTPGASGESILTVSSPGKLTGSMRVTDSSKLWGAAGNVVLAAPRGAGWDWQLRAGLLCVDLQERLGISSVTTPLTPGTTVTFLGQSYAAPAATLPADSFATRNVFYGGQLGGECVCHRGPFYAGLGGKLALGQIYQTVSINGSTYLLNGPNGVASVALGGLFALMSNSGTYHRSSFAAVPELEIKVGCQLTGRVTVSIAYDLLYISSVARPGAQIDRDINLNQVPSSTKFGTTGGPAQPTFTFKDSDYAAQGITVALRVGF
jgi:hypothetical protein